MRTKKFVFIFTFLLSGYLFAQEDTQKDVETKKGISILYAILNQKSTEEYLASVKEIPNHESVLVRTKVFNEILVDHSPSLNKLTTIPDSDLNFRIKNFIRNNGISQSVIGYRQFKTAEHYFVAVIVLIELQKTLKNRTDLNSFGKDTAISFSKSITDTVRLSYKIAEYHIEKALFGISIGTDMKKNFVQRGLRYQPKLTSSEKWVNEMLGNDPNHISDPEPREVIENILYSNNLEIRKNLRASNSCGKLF